jgi:hypothetical protein
MRLRANFRHSPKFRKPMETEEQLPNKSNRNRNEAVISMADQMDVEGAATPIRPEVGADPRGGRSIAEDACASRAPRRNSPKGE